MSASNRAASSSRAVSAGIVVTGTEVLTGRVADQNGPWLAERLLELGVDVGQIVVVGDRPDDLRAALQFLAAGNDLVITSGGLGPTADDLTAEVVAEVQGRPSQLDPELEQRITVIVERLSARFGGRRDPESTAIATRKQAMVPVGAHVLEPSGTAPGLVVPVASGRTGPPVIVLPGPPWELQRMWPAAVAAPAVQAVVAGVPELRQHTLRLWGVPESELAATLRRADGDLAGLEITTCLSGGELEIVSRYPVEAAAAQERLVTVVRNDFSRQLFSDAGASVDELITAGLTARGWTLAVAEAATGGRVSVRLSGGPAFRGSTVLSTVSSATVEDDGTPVGPDVARSMAQGAQSSFGADVGVGITPLVGSGDGSESGDGSDSTVHLSVVTPDGEQSRTLTATVTPDLLLQRVAPAAMHLIRLALAREAD